MYASSMPHMQARVHVATPRGLACHVASTWARALKPFFYFFIIILLF